MFKRFFPIVLLYGFCIFVHFMSNFCFCVILCCIVSVLFLLYVILCCVCVVFVLCYIVLYCVCVVILFFLDLTVCYVSLWLIPHLIVAIINLRIHGMNECMCVCMYVCMYVCTYVLRSTILSSLQFYQFQVTNAGTLLRTELTLKTHSIINVLRLSASWSHISECEAHRAPII
jgi:hypothetical protein